MVEQSHITTIKHDRIRLLNDHNRNTRILRWQTMAEQEKLTRLEYNHSINTNIENKYKKTRLDNMKLEERQRKPKNKNTQDKIYT